MNIKKVFVDENVIIDMFDKNRKNCIVANMIMNYCVDKDIEYEAHLLINEYISVFTIFVV